MHKIQAWLKNGEYVAGVQLYEQYGNNGFLKRQFAKQHTPLYEKMLREELGAISRKLSAISNLSNPTPSDLIPPKSGELKNQVPAMSAAPMKETPSSVLQTKYLQLLKKRERFYLEINIHMEEKHRLPEGFLLHECAKQILTKLQQVTEIYEQLEYYQQHQNFPVIVVEDKPPIEPEKEIQLLRSAISKANGRLRKENCRNRLTTQKTLEANQARLNELLAKRKENG